MQHFLFKTVLISCALSVATVFGSADPKMNDCSYTVPVGRALLGYNAFFLENGEWFLEAGKRIFRYEIPKDLVGGRTLRIELVGPAAPPARGFVTFIGDKAAASCSFTPRISCVVQYRRNAIFGEDPSPAWEESERYLRAKYARSADIEQRVAVARAFFEDPGAFINLPVDE